MVWPLKHLFLNCRACGGTLSLTMQSQPCKGNSRKTTFMSRVVVVVHKHCTDNTKVSPLSVLQHSSSWLLSLGKRSKNSTATHRRTKKGHGRCYCGARGGLKARNCSMPIATWALPPPLNQILGVSNLRARLLYLFVVCRFMWQVW